MKVGVEEKVVRLRYKPERESVHLGRGSFRHR